MPTDFRISDLPTSIPFNNLDLMEVSQVDSQSPSGYSSVKKTMEEIGEKLLNDIQYASALATTNKKIIPAINEINSNIPENSDFSLSGLSDTTITSPSNGQMLVRSGSKWVNKSVETTISIARGSTMSDTFPLPNASRRGNVCIINFAIQIPAGTYANTTTLWEVSPKPIVNTRCMLAFSASTNNFTNVNLLTDGTIKFNGSQTVASDSWLIGQAVYLTDG